MTGLDLTDDVAIAGADLQRDGVVTDGHPGCRTLADAIGFDLRAKGIDLDASAFVEDIFFNPLNETADRAMERFSELNEEGREIFARALIEALTSARTHEGWLALMAGRGASATPLDLETDWWFDDPIIDTEARKIGMTMRVNRQEFRFWMSFAEVLLFAHTLASRFVRAELRDHPASRAGRSPS